MPVYNDSNMIGFEGILVFLPQIKRLKGFLNGVVCLPRITQIFTNLFKI